MKKKILLGVCALIIAFVSVSSATSSANDAKAAKAPGGQCWKCDNGGHCGGSTNTSCGRHSSAL